MENGIAHFHVFTLLFLAPLPLALLLSLSLSLLELGVPSPPGLLEQPGRRNGLKLHAMGGQNLRYFCSKHRHDVDPRARVCVLLRCWWSAMPSWYT